MAGSYLIPLSFVFPIVVLVFYSQSPTHAAIEVRQSSSTGDAHEVHCSRERSRAAWTIIEEHLMPFVKKHGYRISKSCRIHEDNDMYRDQEGHKIHSDVDEWQCGYCKKYFYEEKYLDKHFDNRHYNMLNTNGSRCLADICGALHCDSLMDNMAHKKRCNPAAVTKNKHLCESLANSCFPVSEGVKAIKIHDFFLRQFCDALTCNKSVKPFSKRLKKGRSWLYIATSVVVLLLLFLYYVFLYMFKRGMSSKTKWLKRVSESRLDKKTY